jgi:hypothetical protein
VAQAPFLVFGNRIVLETVLTLNGDNSYTLDDCRKYTELVYNELWLAFSKEFCTLRSSLESSLQKTWLMAKTESIAFIFRVE